MAKLTYYLFQGTNEDFLNTGGPYPGQMPLLKAYQLALDNYLEETNDMGVQVNADNEYNALDGILKCLPKADTPTTIIITNNKKWLTSYQIGWSTGFNLNS